MVGSIVAIEWKITNIGKLNWIGAIDGRKTKRNINQTWISDQLITMGVPYVFPLEETDVVRDHHCWARDWLWGRPLSKLYAHNSQDHQGKTTTGRLCWWCLPNDVWNMSKTLIYNVTADKRCDGSEWEPVSLATMQICRSALKLLRNQCLSQLDIAKRGFIRILITTSLE